MSDDSHNKIDDEGERNNLVEQYSLVKTLRTFNSHIHNASTACQLYQQSKRGYSYLQRHTTRHIQNKQPHCHQPHQSRYGIQYATAASYYSHDVHRHTSHYHRQTERQEYDKTQTLLPVAAAMVEKSG